MAPLTGFPIRGMKRKLRAIGGNVAKRKRWRRRRQWWGLEFRVVAGSRRRQAATVTGALIKKADC